VGFGVNVHVLIRAKEWRSSEGSMVLEAQVGKQMMVDKDHSSSG
jgi:hypothetical protein